jgi:hypothetical protein
LQGASLWSTNLQEANLQESNLEGAVLKSANLRSANLRKANLKGADLTFADLQSATLLNVREMRLNVTRINAAHLSPYASDPWSRLRRSYTGTKFLFHLLLLIAFLVPYVARTMMWVGVNRAEESIRSTTDRLQQVAQKLIEDGHPASILVSKSISELARLGPCLRGDCREYSIWQVLIGVDRSPAYWLLAVTLILYNLGRVVLTFNVGPLREEEERSGYAPALHGFRGYLWLFRIHTVMEILIVLAVISFVFHAWDWLTRPVWLPETGM